MSEHVLRMSEYYNHLNQVGVDLPDKIVIDSILQSLSPSYQNFVMNYNMQGITEMIPKALRDAVIGEGRNQEKASSVDGWQDRQFQVKGQGKERELQRKNGKKVATPMKKRKARPKLEIECFYCKGNGHQKWNCPRYLADNKDGKVNKIIYLIYMLSLFKNSSD